MFHVKHRAWRGTERGQASSLEQRAECDGRGGASKGKGRLRWSRLFLARSGALREPGPPVWCDLMRVGAGRASSAVVDHLCPGRAPNRSDESFRWGTGVIAVGQGRLRSWERGTGTSGEKGGRDADGRPATRRESRGRRGSIGSSGQGWREETLPMFHVKHCATPCGGSGEPPERVKGISVWVKGADRTGGAPGCFGKWLRKRLFHVKQVLTSTDRKIAGC